MAYNEQQQLVSIEASGDLSSDQYRFVSVNSSGQIAVTGDGLAADGVLQDKPAAQGRVGAVAIPNGGVVKVYCGGSVTAGAEVASDANGEALDAVSGDVILGTALTAGDSGDVISILFNVRGKA